MNAFNPETARSYLAAGAAFVLVGADVALLARGSEALAAQYIRPARAATPPPATNLRPFTPKDPA